MRRLQILILLTLLSNLTGKGDSISSEPNRQPESPIASKEKKAVRSIKGDRATTNGGELTITSIGHRLGFGRGEEYDEDIQSPKSVTFNHDGTKFYINSLEGCKTVVYDAKTLKKLKTITYDFNSGTGDKWLPMSGYYKFTHYPDGHNRSFRGKPVEATFSKDGKYLFVPFYRRTFDLNAQDPSALAVIDTEKDEIAMMLETGPLPKMVRISNDGMLLAITHWGDNTIGLVDISDKNPKKWHHLSPITVGKKLELNYSLTEEVNRDSGSGYLLRGTIFLPWDSLLLISGMAGPMAVIDVKKKEWIGMINNLYGIRHIVCKDSMLYMSRNSAGEVLSLPIANIIEEIGKRRAAGRNFNVSGIKTAKVIPGARTLVASPSGKYLFAACSFSSEICVVGAEDMKLIGRIKADSYPVGLDISPDGKLLISTSQANKGVGGNAVDIFSVEYATPEIMEEEPQENLQESADETEQTDVGTIAEKESFFRTDNLILIIGILALIAVGVIAIIYSKRK